MVGYKVQHRSCKGSDIKIHVQWSEESKCCRLDQNETRRPMSDLAITMQTITLKELMTHLLETIQFVIRFLSIILLQPGVYAPDHLQYYVFALSPFKAW
ncbi:uncharacterized protein PHALS_06407 [Plasmopara halstedii]|uniref:Uncharacterized protein n=1 Tax=Plasmopara halstedii TaxID=4781 RepID=A0A0P1B3C9_PLAHL|nr:uncharacterized protein PHALS_06407 [Plasmopara halstedii]CEG48592.1 hypothetical protein PHALS_06407 [Plasmopara halstedii]|eukprot:XP_024584961.1 hypothetical protein PHALS_06407 [Plasmopara halstedii]